MAGVVGEQGWCTHKYEAMKGQIFQNSNPSTTPNTSRTCQRKARCIAGKAHGLDLGSRVSEISRLMLAALIGERLETLSPSLKPRVSKQRR